MLRVLPPALLSLLLSTVAQAQIYTLHFSEEKYAKPYKELLHEWGGEQVVLVEVHSGIKRAPDGKLSWPPDVRLGFYVLDPKDPRKLPYVIKDGAIKKDVRKQVIKINADRVSRIGTFLRDESFYTMSVQYQRRLDAVEALADRRDSFRKETTDWFATHTDLLLELESLEVWLAETGYSRAARDTKKRITKERRKADIAKAARLEAALASRRAATAGQKLERAATAVGGTDLIFHVQETTHVRLIHHAGISDAKAAQLIELAEKTIDAFRISMVDPYLSPDFKDRIPDELFIEYFFSDKSPRHQERLMEQYYGLGWGEGEQRRRHLSSMGSSRRVEKRALSYWRTDEKSDLEGIVIHSLGHELARLHYGITGNQQDWLEEGVGYYLSFQLLGRNNVTCSAFEPPRDEGETVSVGPDRGKKDDKDRETVVLIRGVRDVMAKVALDSGPPFDKLAVKGLFDFENPEMAKSWAFYSFIADAAGLEGQIWLRGLDPIIRKHDFPVLLRKLTEETFADLSGNAVKLLEERWEEYLRGKFDL